MSSISVVEVGTGTISVSEVGLVVVNFDYSQSYNKPSINGKELSGSLSLSDIGINETSISKIDAMFK